MMINPNMTAGLVAQRRHDLQHSADHARMVRTARAAHSDRRLSGLLDSLRPRTVRAGDVRRSRPATTTSVASPA